MMKNIFLIVLMALISMNLSAEETATSPEKKAEKTEETIGAAEQKKKKRTPVQILADEAEFDDKNQQVRYKGNVVVNDNGMKLTCEQMTVYLTKKKEISRILAKEDVVIVRSVRNKKGELEQMTAISDEAEYFQKDEKVILRGNAELERGTEKLKSNQITFYRNSSVVKTGRAAMTFNAETAEEASSDDSKDSEEEVVEEATETEETKSENPLLKPKSERKSVWDDEDED